MQTAASGLYRAPVVVYAPTKGGRDGVRQEVLLHCNIRRDRLDGRVKLLAEKRKRT
jgi:hypothetical protein